MSRRTPKTTILAAVVSAWFVGVVLAVGGCSLNPQPLPPGGGDNGPLGVLGNGETPDAGAALSQTGGGTDAAAGGDGGATDAGDAAMEGATTSPGDSAAPDAPIDGRQGDAGPDVMETPE